MTTDEALRELERARLIERDAEGVWTPLVEELPAYDDPEFGRIFDGVSAEALDLYGQILAAYREGEEMLIPPEAMLELMNEALGTSFATLAESEAHFAAHPEDRQRMACYFADGTVQ
jgi:hypothetical protein